MENELDQAFAVFSAIKRAVGLVGTPYRNTHTVTIAPSTRITRRYTGFGESSRDAVKFGIAILEGVHGCNRSLDSVLGKRWDVVPRQNQHALDTVIKSMRFTEQREFGTFLIKCTVTASEGRYIEEPDYRALVRKSLGTSASWDYL